MLGFFRKPKKQPADALRSERYAGRPLLILLENYVLDSIGELPEDKQATTQAIVDRVFGGGSDWRRALRDRLELSADLDDTLRSMWLRNQELARKSAITLSTLDFARSAVDQNFAHLID